MILNTISRFSDAQSIGIEVLEKYKNMDKGIVPELQEIAFHVQSLARGWRSQQDRADECYEKYIEKPDVKKALSEAVAAIYFDDNSDYSSALWQVIAALGGNEAIELLEEDGNAAYKKYCNEDL